MPLMVQKRETTLVRQKEIVDAARKLIIKYGSEHVTVKRIAKEVGFTEGAIYRHFKSKRDILSFLADHIEDDLMGDIEEGNISASGRSPLQVLDNILSRHLSAIAQRKGMSFQVIAEIISLGDKKLNKKISDTISRYTSRIKDVLAGGVKAGEIREDIDLDSAAVMFFGMVQGLVGIWTLSNHSFSLEERRGPLWSIFREAVVRR
ncbi:MAG: TetR/AcrR family transcriptional regulator [Chloroflexi bacterium]|nr:TetR/AcrR family transcriptional regulator [Chloroflexota bacterium]